MAFSEDPWGLVEDWFSRHDAIRDAVGKFHSNKSEATYAAVRAALESEGEGRARAEIVIREALGRGAGTVKITKHPQGGYALSRKLDNGTWHEERTVHDIGDAKAEARAMGCDIPVIDI
ncbi:hypothetical protein J2732_001969 [Achromobacter deleyi]|uniref:hypothetical protein n=1 Tax=Achromobacter deleyi TaxID=1353891 RepID=UPI002857367A|nr:hypothetical protein [Achromobacter deleyi]MDR6600986.1 hypothetical protein [Achromobacter deleyi]